MKGWCRSASETERAEDSAHDGRRTGDDPSVVMATMMVVVPTAVVHRGRAAPAAEAVGPMMRGREASSRQRKSGHEGHDQFLVVRFITFLFLPEGLTSRQGDRERTF